MFLFNIFLLYLLISKMPLRYRKKRKGVFFVFLVFWVFFNSHANTEKVRKEPCYLFNSRSALRGEQSALPQASAPCLDGLVRGCVFAKNFSSIILLFFRSSLALSVLMNLRTFNPSQITLVSVVFVAFHWASNPSLTGHRGESSPWEFPGNPQEIHTLPTTGRINLIEQD